MSLISGLLREESRQEAGGRRQETGGRSQEPGRGREMGARSQEAGGDRRNGFCWGLEVYWR